MKPEQAELVSRSHVFYMLFTYPLDLAGFCENGSKCIEQRSDVCFGNNCSCDDISDNKELE